MSPTYDRPVEAKLVVQLENGESWSATKEDLRKFGYVDRVDAYMRFRKFLVLALAPVIDDDDVTTAALNPLRYLVELASYDDPEIAPSDEDLANVALLERALRAHHAEDAA